MTINGLGALSWYTSLRSSSTQSSGSGGTSSPASSSDTASISAAAFAALLRSQQGEGPAELTDDQAAAVGAALKTDNQGLFTALDSDSDASLSASELKTGMDSLRPQGMGGGRPPAGGPPPGPPPEPTDEDAAAIGSSLQEDNSTLFGALDADGDGVLSADELKSGMDSLHSAMEQSGIGPPPPPSGGSGSTGATTDWLAQLQGDSSANAMSAFQANYISQVLQSLFTDSQQK